MFHSEKPQGLHGPVEPEHDGPFPHLADTHPQYPEGFPERPDDSYLGHWPIPGGIAVVEHHPHGWEIHVRPCYDFEACDACAPDRGPSNPHTDDGHHFRECQNRNGPILTIAGDKPRTVLEYLAYYGSAPHMEVLIRAQAEEAKADADSRAREREETMRQELEEAENAPPPENRLDALEAEIKELRRRLA